VAFVKHEEHQSATSAINCSGKCACCAWIIQKLLLKALYFYEEKKEKITLL
jgi:hypothetical protein